MENNKLKERFKEIVNDYMYAWAEKHEYDYEEDMWVADNYGTICMVGDMFVSFDDVRYDIDNNLPEHIFDEWYWYSLEISEMGCKANVNLKSYAMGYRPFSDEQLELIRSTSRRIKEQQVDLERLLEQTKANKYV